VEFIDGSYIEIMIMLWNLSLNLSKHGLSNKAMETLNNQSCSRSLLLVCPNTLLIMPPYNNSQFTTIYFEEGHKNKKPTQICNPHGITIHSELNTEQSVLIRIDT
jgi:hypothetical protein